MSAEPTYYDVLGIDPTATQADIKAAFRRNVNLHHPDKGGDREQFELLEDAYETLVSPSQRVEYDAMLGFDVRTPPRGTRMPPPPAADKPPPTFIGGPGSERTWRPRQTGSSRPGGPTGPKRPSVKRTVLVALAVWVGIAMLFGQAVFPGFTADSLASFALLLFLFWVFGSLVLRLTGWVLVIYALIAAHWGGAGLPLTVFRLAVATGLWLCGHWFYTWKRGRWHSHIAHNLLIKLPEPLRPDRRWGSA